MPYESWSTLAGIGTFIVFAATAIAAIIQLRHLRANNELNSVLAIFGRKETPLDATSLLICSQRFFNEGERFELPCGVQRFSFRQN